MPELPDSRISFHACGTEFLLLDLELGLTFVDIAAVSAGSGHREQALVHAKTAYHTVLKFLPKVRPSMLQQQIIREKLILLENRMTAYGPIPGSH